MSFPGWLLRNPVVELKNKSEWTPVKEERISVMEERIKLQRGGGAYCFCCRGFLEIFFRRGCFGLRGRKVADWPEKEKSLYRDILRDFS